MKDSRIYQAGKDPSASSSFNSILLTELPKTVSKSIGHILIELLKDLRHDNFPGEPVPVTDHSLSEKPFSYVLPELLINCK